MARNLLIVTALSLGVGAAVVGLWPEPAAERVASRAEMMAGHVAPVVQPASAAGCGPVVPPRAPADI